MKVSPNERGNLGAKARTFPELGEAKGELMVETILDWNERRIAIVRSIGGVKAVVDFGDNLIRGHVKPWPPPEIVQKAYSSDTSRSFSQTAVLVATDYLHHYSALQSIHSEDAVTWSVFGPVIYSPLDVQDRFARELCGTLNVSASASGRAQWWLWRRIPHPDKPVSGGPEIDVGLAIGNVVIFGEAKWGSDVGRGQGTSRAKDQVTLRREWCEGLGPRLYPDVRQFVVLGISRTGDMLAGREEECGRPSVVYRDTTWEELAALPSHPVRDELHRYLAWKDEHTRESGGERRNRLRRASAAKDGSAKAAEPPQ